MTRMVPNPLYPHADVSRLERELRDISAYAVAMRAALDKAQTALRDGDIGAARNIIFAARHDAALAKKPTKDALYVGDDLDALAEAVEQRNEIGVDQDRVALIAFFSKHALGPLAAPSCLVCGRADRITYPPGPAIQHAELPGVVVCFPCRDAAMQGHSQGSHGEGA